MFICAVVIVLQAAPSAANEEKRLSGFLLLLLSPPGLAVTGNRAEDVAGVSNGSSTRRSKAHLMFSPHSIGLLLIHPLLLWLAKVMEMAGHVSHSDGRWQWQSHNGMVTAGCESHGNVRRGR